MAIDNHVVENRIGQQPEACSARVRKLLDAGRLLEAARLAESELPARQSDPRAYSDVGRINLQAGQIAKALHFFSQAVRLAPSEAIRHFHLAYALEMLGRDGEAITGYRRAVALAPNDSASLERLANLLLSYGQRDEAIACLQSASAAAPNTIASYLNRAAAFTAEGSSDKAEAVLREAVKRFSHSSEAHRLLASILRERGDFDEAIPLLIQATEGNIMEAATAYYDLANSKRITDDDQPMLHQMRSMLLRSDLANKYRARLNFGLGKALDDLARYDEAIRCFDEANKLAREGRTFDRAHFGASIHRLITNFTGESLREQAVDGSASELPVFIVGMPRSGTTLVEQVISSHPTVAAGGELPFWNERAVMIAKNPELDRAQLAATGVEYQRLLRGISETAIRVTDKQPGNFLWIGLIHTVFPRARFIHCRRHPVDTCLSNYFTNFNSPLTYSYDRADLAFYYRSYERLMLHWHSVLPPGILLDVQYEDLVAAPEQSARSIIKFIGLDWDDACLRPEANRARIKTASSWQARQPTYRSSVARWRNYEPWLGELRELLTTPRESLRAQPVSDDAAIPVVRRLQGEGRLDEALSKIQQALRKSPNDPILYNEGGAICLLSDQVALAVDCFERAIGLCPYFATAHYNLGAALERQGRRAEAITMLRRATELSPDLGPAYSRLGNLLQAGGDKAAASECFQRASELLIKPSDQELEEAKLLLSTGETAKAEPKLRSVIALDPKNSLAHAILGDLLGQMGRFDEATPLLRRSFELDPSRISALHNLVTLTKVTAAEQPLVDMTLSLLAQPGCSEFDRLLLHFALGKAYDDLGDYARAIHHFDAGNAIEHSRTRFDRTAFVTEVDRVIAAFPSERFAKLRSGSASDLPLLVLGMPRSGTTLVEQIISSHSKVEACGELEFWTSSTQPIRPDATPPALVNSLGAKYLNVLRGIAPNALRATDKNPFNFLYIGLIHLALPKARFVHCRRDPVSTCLSVYFTRFAFPQPFAYERGDIVFYYRQYQRLMAHWRTVLPPDRLLEVDYEQLVADPRQVTQEIVKFAGLDWEERCLHPEQNAHGIKTASIWQARQPIYKASKERWRNYEAWLGSIGELHHQD